MAAQPVTSLLGRLVVFDDTQRGVIVAVSQTWRGTVLLLIERPTGELVKRRATEVQVV
jgi:hypothetical protein